MTINLRHLSLQINKGESALANQKDTNRLNTKMILNQKNNLLLQKFIHNQLNQIQLCQLLLKTLHRQQLTKNKMVLIDLIIRNRITQEITGIQITKMDLKVQLGQDKRLYIQQ
mmetsp:Transcript_8376/g.11551  ORF Transcript_8376/g.11551 Transcript_8376/m.11551 type:complete len:113 (+) Transcript_8376:283-621(+)